MQPLFLLKGGMLRCRNHVVTYVLKFLGIIALTLVFEVECQLLFFSRTLLLGF